MKASDFKETKEIRFNDVKVKWAKLVDPDRRYEPTWKIDIVLPKDDAAAYIEAGFNVRQDKQGDMVLQAKRKCETKNGVAMSPPEVYGRDGQSQFSDRIGNGSTCNLICRAREYATGKVVLYLNAVQVVDWVEAPPMSTFGNVDDASAGGTGTDAPF